MVTLEHINSNILSNIGDLEKQILLDFINSFMAVFPNTLSQEELLNRINGLKYIGFEKETLGDVYKVPETDNGKFVPGVCISISKKYRNDDYNTIKSFFYHELMHAISRHAEIDLDSINKDSKTNRTGLDRKNWVSINEQNLDALPFSEGAVLEEIMTEYYAICLLKHENINIDGKFILKNDDLEQDYIETHGTSYLNYSGLGQIYDFLFGKMLLNAKFRDGNAFRNYFNDVFENTGIFKNMFVDSNVTPYSKFVKQSDPIERYKTACKMFVTLLRQQYIDKEVNINEVINNKNLIEFISMLVKTRNKFDNNNRVNDQFYLMMQELEFNLVRSFSQGAQLENNLVNNDTQTLIYILYKKLALTNPTIKLEDVNYNSFTFDRFNGIIATIGGQEYVLDAEFLEQELNCSGLQTFKENIEDYSSAYGFDVTDAEYATLYNPTSGYNTVIKKDGVWYNHHGQEIELSPSCNLIYGENSRELTNNKPKTLVKKLPSDTNTTSAGFISVISLILIIIVTISITAFLYNMLN